MTLAEPYRAITFFFSCQLLIPHMLVCCYGEEKILLFLRDGWRCWELGWWMEIWYLVREKERKKAPVCLLSRRGITCIDIIWAHTYIHTSALRRRWDEKFTFEHKIRYIGTSSCNSRESYEVNLHQSANSQAGVAPSSAIESRPFSSAAFIGSCVRPIQSSLFIPTNALPLSPTKKKNNNKFISAVLPKQKPKRKSQVIFLKSFHA
jgi:hypothetical protein